MESIICAIVISNNHGIGLVHTGWMERKVGKNKLTMDFELNKGAIMDGGMGGKDGVNTVTDSMGTKNV